MLLEGGPILDTPITEEDLDFIDAMLEKYVNDEAIFTVSELDGFLTAIVSSPDMIMPSEWLPEIWGGEEKSPEWESDEEAMRFIRLVMGMLNDNATTLVERPADFQALFLMDVEDDKPVKIVTLWCCGYMRGMSMRWQSWQDLPPAVEENLGRIVLFGSVAVADVLEQLPLEIIDEESEKIEPAVRAIHGYWLAQRAHLAPPGHFDTPVPGEKVVPFVRSQPKIGPNQPCPCGSGKKYKKCCGAP